MTEKERGRTGFPYVESLWKNQDCMKVLNLKPRLTSLQMDQEELGLQVKNSANILEVNFAFLSSVSQTGHIPLKTWKDLHTDPTLKGN